MTHPVDVWNGCYPSNWKGKIVAKAMTHPAKFSSRLIRKIYDHILSEGWVQAGDHVIDPFGGVALGALDALTLGLHWHGVELEEKFQGIGNENIDKWMYDFRNLPSCGTASLHKGDSRHLLEILKNSANVAVSSPPYAETPLSYQKNGLHDRNTGKYYRPYMIDSNVGYGETDGQLGDMKAEGFEIAISSPPFMQSDGGGTVPSFYKDDPTFMARHAAGNKSSNAYGTSKGQLSSMKEGGFDAAVSSPPYESSLPYDDRDFSGLKEHLEKKYKRTMEKSMEVLGSNDYGTAEGNLGNDSGNDFWLAARAIVEQVYLALAPGGHACWVVKDYVKKKQIVPFCDQWRQLCEAVGFVTVHEHHASLIRNVRTQHTLDGGTVTLQSENKSFFRRVAEKKGSPRIDYEVVFCMEKPSEPPRK